EAQFINGVAKFFCGLDEGLTHNRAESTGGSMPRLVLAGAMQLPQRSLEVLDFPLVIDLLPFGKFQRFEHFFHFFKRMLQLAYNTVDLVDGIGNRGRFSRRLRFLMVFGLLDSWFRRFGHGRSGRPGGLRGWPRPAAFRVPAASASGASRASGRLRLSWPA